MISSRQIERACKENVTFMALTCGEQPDHSTIAAFVSSMKDEVLAIFRDVLLVCEEEGWDAYIPDKRFRIRDPRFQGEHRQRQRRADRLTLADIEHDEQRDEYRCPKGRVFRLEVKETVTDGIIYRSIATMEMVARDVSERTGVSRGRRRNAGM